MLKILGVKSQKKLKLDSKGRNVMVFNNFIRITQKEKLEISRYNHLGEFVNSLVKIRAKLIVHRQCIVGIELWVSLSM